MGRLELRAYAGEADVEHVARVSNAEWEADNLPGRTTAAQQVARYRHPTDTFEPRRDVTLAIVEGEVVGISERSWVDTNDGPYREYRVDGAVAPPWRRRGIGTALLQHGERMMRELAATHDTRRATVYGTWSGDSQTGDVALLERHGYTPVRWFFDMTRPNLDDVPDVPLPAGLQLRPITPELYRPVWRADVEAFRDHWGGSDDSEEVLMRYLDQPNHDPTLWLIAFDGDEVAGGVINAIDAHENEALGLRRGWLNSVFTRRPWRRRGLANALIARSLVLLRERGMTSAVLGVDADNPTGALGLYERNGFAVTYRSTAWRKPMAADHAALAD